MTKKSDFKLLEPRSQEIASNNYKTFASFITFTKQNKINVYSKVCDMERVNNNNNKFILKMKELKSFGDNQIFLSMPLWYNFHRYLLFKCAQRVKPLFCLILLYSPYKFKSKYKDNSLTFAHTLTYKHTITTTNNRKVPAEVFPSKKVSVAALFTFKYMN